MTVRHRRCYKYAHSLFLCLCLSLLLAAAGCGGSSSMSSGSTTKVLSSIATSPATADLAVGATEQFTAQATYNDGSTADVTSSATWADANGKVATITSSGLATGVAAGSTTVTASMGALSGTADLTIAAQAKTLASIAVSPANATIAAGATQQFAAKATYSDGSTADVTTSAAWVSSKPAVASISAAGLATALSSGSTIVTATLTGVSGTAAVTVPQPPPPSVTVTSIAVTPPTASIAVGATQQFVATATYSDGTTGNVTTTAAWTSSKPTVATVASGLATSLAAGSTALTATLNGVHGTATLTVTPILSSIAVTPNPAAIEIGATQQFTATATYSDSSTKVVSATWKSTNTGVATVNATGLATGVAAGPTTVTATFNGVSGSATLNVTATTISISPNPASFVAGATQQFTATATSPGGSPTDVTATATWTIANTAVATVNAGGLATGVATGSTSIKASLSGASGSASITVTLPAGSGVNIPTWHVDNNRSGLNPNEKSLTPANVAAGTFGKLFSYLVDGYAYAEPLLMSNVTIKSAVHNVLYVATEYDSVYAFDADTYGTGAPLWKTSLLQSGETPLTGATVQPYQGVTSTPVIDQSSNTIYVVSAQKSSANGASYRLNALDITTGQPKQAAVTITASVSGTNSTASGGQVSLPAGCVQRAALLLANGTIYIGVGSCHSGWLLSYDEQTLQQTGVFNASPNIDGEGTYGGAGGVWMGSGGPVADSAGNIYISTGNGPWNPSQGSYADSILKFSPSLALLDYFTPQDYAYMNCQDSDLAAGGLLMIPGSGQIVGGGKMGRIYLVNTGNLGQEQTGDAGAVDMLYVEQGIDNSQPYPSSCTDVSGTHNVSGINSYEIFGTSAYFHGSIYLGVTPTSTTNAPGVVRRFTYTAGSTSATGTLAAEETTPLNIAQQQPENTRGTTPFISANGTNDGILWTIDQGQPLQTPLGPQATTNATLYAYDATNLSNLLYSSSANSGDVPGFGIKFSSPIVANGKVYISTGHDPVTASQPQGEIDVYGLN
jgi:uncharacterized protein YjdB